MASVLSSTSPQRNLAKKNMTKIFVASYISFISRSLTNNGALEECYDGYPHIFEAPRRYLEKWRFECHQIGMNLDRGLWIPVMAPEIAAINALRRVSEGVEGGRFGGVSGL